MGEKSKWLILGCISSIFIGFALIAEITGKVNLFVSFLAAFIAFGMSISTKLLINSYMELTKYKVINLLVMNNITKLLILILFFYFEIKFYYTYVDGSQIARFILEFYILDLFGVLFIKHVYVEHREIRYNLGYMFVLIAVTILICQGIALKHIKILGRISNGISIVIVTIILWKWRSKKIQGISKDLNYCKGYLILNIIQCSLMLFLYKWLNEYYLTLATCGMVQSFWLFGYVYRSCLVEPWHEKIEALNEADSAMDKQSETCDKIVNLSHELKTPINVIRSALTLIALDYTNNQVVIDEVLDIKSDCNRVMNIIQNMIDIQKVKGNYIEIKYETYNLVEIIENVVDAFASEMDENPFIFNPLNEEIYQEVDINLLQQCFMLLFYMIMKQELTQELYIEMDYKKETGEVYVNIRHQAIKSLREISKQIEQGASDINQVDEILNMELVLLILELHKVQIQYDIDESKQQLKMTFPSCNNTSEVWIDEENLYYLKEQIKARDMIG